MTKEQLLDNATFIELFSISNEIERTKKIIELSDKAKEYKCSREFNRMLKVYEKELADKVSFDNEIVIKDIPLSGLSCSSFICNAKGIFKKGEKICYTPVIICEILTNKETKNEKVKLAVYNIKTKNKYLFDTAKRAGVINYARFNDYGYQGLYGGEKAKDIAKRKGIDPSKEEILDHMNSNELAANLFRITQTDEVIKNNNIIGERNACNTHHMVGKAIRNTIIKVGGTPPEKLPTPEKSIKEIEKEELKKIEIK